MCVPFNFLVEKAIKMHFVLSDSTCIFKNAFEITKGKTRFLHNIFSAEPGRPGPAQLGSARVGPGRPGPARDELSDPAWHFSILTRIKIKKCLGCEVGNFKICD